LNQLDNRANSLNAFTLILKYISDMRPDSDDDEIEIKRITTYGEEQL
jgi:hypothetical protein